METLKIALVKQEVYQDLYVCPSDEKCPTNILFSSMGRVGPIGLFTLLNADFYILKEEYSKECQVYRKVILHVADDLPLLKTTTLDKLPNQSFKRPGSQYCNGDFSVSCFNIDWSQYDIVISVNVSIPKSLIAQYQDTLFCYMIGEANLASKRVKFGYDVCLNQQARGYVQNKMGVVDFPYTFVGPNCLETVMYSYLGRESKKNGIFAEINTSTERPVVNIPEQFVELEKLGHPIRLHKQLISENLTELYDAKYFVKLGGRDIRGNSVIESISSGTLVLMDPAQVIHSELLPKESWISSKSDVHKKIEYFDNNPDEYYRVLHNQKDLLQKYCFEVPMQSLENCLTHKRTSLLKKIQRLLIRKGII